VHANWLLAAWLSPCRPIGCIQLASSSWLCFRASAADLQACLPALLQADSGGEHRALHLQHNGARLRCGGPSAAAASPAERCLSGHWQLHSYAALLASVRVPLHHHACCCFRLPLPHTHPITHLCLAWHVLTLLRRDPS
jgi:hypothetical protein